MFEKGACHFSINYVYTDKRDDLFALIDEVCSRGAFYLAKICLNLKKHLQALLKRSLRLVLATLQTDWS